MSLLQHAKNELEIAGFYKEDTLYGGMIPEAVLELMEVFAKQGHSGGSAPIVANLFFKLALYKNLSPVTGEDIEWSDTINIPGRNVKPLFQNKRCSALFKEGVDGKPYYLDAIVWRTQNGGSFSGSAKREDGEVIYSRNYVKSFPFEAKTFYVDVIEREVEKDNWEFTIKDVEQLMPVFEYYDQYKHEAK